MAGLSPSRLVRETGAAVRLAAAVLVWPQRAAASCGDYVTIADGHGDATNSSAHDTHPTDGRPASPGPCHGPNRFRGPPRPLPMPATPESSRAALVTTLDGWKAGRVFNELAAASPPLYFRDDDLNCGSRLLDYQIDGDGKPLGTGYSYVVTLTVQDKDGARPPAKKKVAYTAVTDPNSSVSREDRVP